ncbi:hypothetical protein CIG75_19080 [Tumebacillus algifaecis]|uniref:Uncharacterized protein n=1 Tax=Tumebacillus algifaecis TaxID=1214604 RepID=A0A223D5S4_9BACL|nr:hypothetical protein [Tumebacillus algifaecis]ASS76837.1 hypothetical protein CIG75_19080 [Tumebacillus algifaecis]
MSEKTNQYKTTWYFEVVAEAGLGIDNDTGEPAPVYTKFSMDHKVPIEPERYEEMNIDVAAYLAETLNVPVEHIKSITEAEYNENADE